RTISPPTPATMSIIIVLSGSTSTLKPTLKPPLCSHVHAVYVMPACASEERRARKAQRAPPNATKTLRVESHAAARREMRVPPRRIRTVPASGAKRQSQAPFLIRAAPTAGRRRARGGGGGSRPPVRARRIPPTLRPP